MKDIIIPVCLFIFTSIVGGILHWKSKADKAEIKEVINIELKPLEDKMEAVQESVRTLETKREVSDEKFNNLLEAIGRNNEISRDIKNMIEKHDTKNRESFLSIFKILEKKQDK